MTNYCRPESFSRRKTTSITEFLIRKHRDGGHKFGLRVGAAWIDKFTLEFAEDAE
jgi:hypothetical protein